MTSEKNAKTNEDQLLYWLKHLSEQFTTSIIITNPLLENNPIIYCNNAFISQTGYMKEEIIGNDLTFLQNKSSEKYCRLNIDDLLQKDQHANFEVLNYRKDGTPFWADFVVHPITSHNDNAVYLFWIMKDETIHKQAESLFLLERKVYAMIENGGDIETVLENICTEAEHYFHIPSYCSIILINEDTIHVAAAKSLPKEYSEAFEGAKIGPKAGSCGTAAYRKETVIVDDIENSPLWEDYKELPLSHGLRSCWSTPIFNPFQEVIGTFAIYFKEKRQPRATDLLFLDRIAPLVSLSVKYAEHQDEILRLAYFDIETGIPNRHYFANNLTDLINENKAGFIKILEPSEFASIVETYGRRAGDELLSQIAGRIRKNILNKDDFLARFSSSSLIMSRIISMEELTQCPSQLKELTSTPYQLGDKEVFVSFKIGVSSFNSHSTSEECVRFADTALAKARQESGTIISFFDEERDEKLKRDMMLLNELYTSINKDEFDVYIQPKIALKTGDIVSFEALARWNTSKLGNVPPNVFVPLAENAGKIRELENQIFRKILNWLYQRKEQQLPLYQVAINISPNHFYHPLFIEDILLIAKQFEIDPKYIKLEITESIGITDFERAKKIINQLKEHGFESSVDDFGVGFSSLSYLQQLPFSEIKIDRSFINNIHEPGTLAIVRTIVQLATNLNMYSVAEGIETAEQLQVLEAIGCSTGQGYLFYKPMPLEIADQVLKEITKT